MEKVIHYVLILDKSGSMRDIKPLVIQSYNEQIEMIGKLQSEEPEAKIKITLCTFNDVVQFHFIGGNVDQIQKLTPDNYLPDSMTALYDAIGISLLKISEFKNSQDKVVFAIFTDGLENASKHYSDRDIQYKIKMAESEGWSIRFFCKYEDLSHYITKLNLKPDCALELSLDKKGFKSMENNIMYCLRKTIEDDKSK